MNTQSPTVTLNEKETLFEQGDSADALYILQSGELGVRLRGDDNAWIEIDLLKPESIVGEMGLLSGQPRTATVYARTDSTLTRVTLDEYNEMTLEGRKPFVTIAEEMRPRWQRLQLAHVITDLFGEVDAATLLDIQAKLTWKHYTSGDILMRQGDVANAMYLIVSGRVQFVLADGKVVGEAASGETVGEYALLSTGVRSATVRAMRDTSVAIMTQAMFEELIVAHPTLLRAITQIIVERRQRTLGVLPPKKQSALLSLTLIPTHPTTDGRPFASQLDNALKQYGDALVLDAATFEAQSGLSAQTTIDDPNNLAVVRWLDEQEALHHHLIFIPDGEWSAWTRRCISQSDRVLLLADRERSAEISPLEQQLQTTFPHNRRDLVMWHPADTTEPSETARWLEQRDVQTHYHVRDGDAGHFGRLARRLTNRAIGLALAGGGARGFVHLGVFQALEEANVPVDYIGGASFGALIGVNRAREFSTAEILDQSAQTAKKKLLFDTTLPLVALNNSRNVTKALKATFGDVQIEDLWIPYFAIAANLTTQRMEVIERGAVWLAVRKSISIPGVFAPVVEDGELIVDGGVMNNFPADVMIDRAESSRVIGVRCAPSGSKKYTYDMENSVSGWRVLFNQLNPFTKRLRMPRIADTVLRSVLVNSSRLAEQNEKLCDLYLNLRPKGFSLLRFEAYREISDFGYETSVAPVAEWAKQQTDLG